MRETYNGRALEFQARPRQADAMALTYGEYLRLDQLLSAQQPLSSGPEHDEWLFITVHQVYELWFKQMLLELAELQRALGRDDTSRALVELKRLLTVQKTLVQQVDVLETMTPLSFSSFRARLATASGFESEQFRLVEFALGHKRESAWLHYPEGSVQRERLLRAYQAPTLWDAFLGYLQRLGFALPESALRRDVRQPIAASSGVQAVLLQVYQRDPLTSQLCERLVDLDEGVQEWRYRHVKMVERTIGTKRGSGGSSGVDYLKTTLFQPLFPDLWAIRVQM